MKQTILGLLMSNVLVFSQMSANAQTPSIEFLCNLDQRQEKKLVVKLDSATVVCRKNKLAKNEVDEVSLFKTNAQGTITAIINVTIYEKDIRLVIVGESPSFTQTAFLTMKRKFYDWMSGVKDVDLINKYRSDISRIFDVLERYPRQERSFEEF